MSWNIVPWRHGCPEAAALFTKVIARMFGKAVKLRHCPATVSATVSACMERVFQVGAGIKPGVKRHTAMPLKTTGDEVQSSLWLWSLGRWLKEAQVRRPVRGVFNRFPVPRGTKEPSCQLPAFRPRG